MREPLSWFSCTHTSLLSEKHSTVTQVPSTYYQTAQVFMLISFESKKKQEECSWGQILGPWVTKAFMMQTEARRENCGGK